MSVSPISSSHVAPQPTSAPAPTKATAAKNGAVAHLAENARPVQAPSTAPGTGQVVDKHV